MDIEDVDVTYDNGGIVVVHRACGETVEQYTLSVPLNDIVSDVEAADHECDSV